MESQATTQPFQAAMDLILDWAAQAVALALGSWAQQLRQAVAVAKSLASSMERLFQQTSLVLSQLV